MHADTKPPGTEAVDQFIAAESLNAIMDYYAAANAFLVIWHYLLTFDHEVEFFWRRKLTGPCALFLATRYSTIVWSIYDTCAFSIGKSSVKECVRTTYVVYFLEYSQYVAWGALSTLRVYALRKQWTWAALVFLLNLFPVVARAVQLWFQEVFGTADSHINLVCTVTVDKFVLNLTIASRVSLIIGDIIVLGVTWSVTHMYRSRDILRGFGRKTTLTSVLYNNGAIYFVVLTTLNMIYLGVILFQDTLDGRARERMGLVSDCVAIAYDSFTTILVTHFLVRLQEAALPAFGSEYLGSGTPEDTNTLRFARADIDSWAREGSEPSPSAEVSNEEE